MSRSEQQRRIRTPLLGKLRIPNPPQPRVSARGTSAPKQVRLERWRIHGLLLFGMFLLGMVLVRVVELQVVRHAELSQKAEHLIELQLPIAPTRGAITDRMGNVLAMDVDRKSLWVVPGEVQAERVPALALSLSALVQRSPQELEAALTARDRYWVRVARWLEPEVANQIAALAEPGLRLEYDPHRVYPQGSFAAQLIGTVNHNGDGISGIEGFFNSALKGVPGVREGEFDSLQRPIAIAPMREVPPRDGVQLQTTIDPRIQYLVEHELHSAVERHRADGGSIIVLDVQTGAVRGMASWPPFDPNNYTAYPPEVYGRNPAISDLYEPGSTFKMFTVAAGLQSRAFSADTLVHDTGVIARHGFTLKNWNAAGNGMLDSAGIMYYSSNVGALLLNELTGPEAFYQSIADFGFGRPTGIELAGEEQGIVNAWGGPNYNDLTFLTNAYGQGISVTPLQLVVAAAAIANDGILMRPYIIEQRCEGAVCVATEPVEAGRPIEPGVAWTIRRMMVHSANHYAPVVWGPRTGSYADQWLVPGYQIGAKTGTSSIPLPGGGYDPQYTIGSVLGFGPAEEAQFAVLVKIDRPKDDIWGVATAIPVFYRIMDELMRYERIAPDPNLFSPGQAQSQARP
ncbi:peptidoglycan D,D-transpeptidase FtsI family protein [Candidatus Viridilinea mediisalina]|uniref:Peptidoglycan glycosyltransferase n=1 Tax=Candidatus Viridilinea mediisalina TaxID=2024553 RepID=A0A2A6RPP2_9CHLR|nr:penicillin-binding protein 2 [Candidatus Viridilinea mediisalina]PDW04896.1 peptidoglycan glycosyltransferase [Candidatus Viridilinea mediisalina]